MLFKDRAVLPRWDALGETFRDFGNLRQGGPYLNRPRGKDGSPAIVALINIVIRFPSHRHAIIRLLSYLRSPEK